MKKWAMRFWNRHGERTVFLSGALIMATAFLFFPDLEETGRTVLIGIVMLLFNKARSPEDREQRKEDTTKEKDNG